jgi:hypothetical protein
MPYRETRARSKGSDCILRNFIKGRKRGVEETRSMPTTGGVSGFAGFLPGFLVFTSNQFQLLANFGNGLAYP